MARIANAHLSISLDNKKKLVTPVVKCRIEFTGLELCMMKSCPKEEMFKLKCELWGFDPLRPDEKRWVYNDLYYFPDATIAANENRSFEVILGEGVLDEDLNDEDEIYGLVRLTNLLSNSSRSRRTNIVQMVFD